MNESEIRCSFDVYKKTFYFFSSRFSRAAVVRFVQLNVCAGVLEKIMMMMMMMKNKKRCNRYLPPNYTCCFASPQQLCYNQNRQSNVVSGKGKHKNERKWEWEKDVYVCASGGKVYYYEFNLSRAKKKES